MGKVYIFMTSLAAECWSVLEISQFTTVMLCPLRFLQRAVLSLRLLSQCKGFEPSYKAFNTEMSATLQRQIGCIIYMRRGADSSEKHVGRCANKKVFCTKELCPNPATTLT